MSVCVYVYVCVCVVCVCVCVCPRVCVCVHTAINVSSPVSRARQGAALSNNMSFGLTCEHTYTHTHTLSQPVYHLHTHL